MPCRLAGFPLWISYPRFSLFFLCLSPKEILYDYKTYLKIYYDSLSSILTEFEYDPKAIMIFGQIEDQWKKYCKIGLHMAMNIIKLMLSDINEISDCGKDILDVFDYISKNIDIYEKRIADILLFLHEHDFLIN